MYIRSKVPSVYLFSIEKLKPSLCLNLNVKGCSDCYFLQRFAAIRILIQNAQDEHLFPLLAQGCQIHMFCFLNCPNCQAMVLLQALLVKWFYFVCYTEVVTEPERQEI